MKIAVTGAFSYSGKYMTRRLLERGEEVITLTGHPDRPDPFGGKVKAYPLDFDQDSMSHSLQGVDVLVNTYWVRFDKDENTQPRAVENTRATPDTDRLDHDVHQYHGGNDDKRRRRVVVIRRTPVSFHARGPSTPGTEP